MSVSYQQILQAAIKAGYLGDEQALAAFVDTTSLTKTISTLHQAFPEHFTHTFAAKANTMSSALALVKEQGMGCEVASPGELEQAIRAGFEPEKIVYDEPAKTKTVLEKVLSRGISLNIDNFQEFERVRALVRETGSRSRIGFRINPQVGAGKISAMSTATRTSKFGFALEDEGNRQAIVDCYTGNSWLTSLHTHVGSQGCSLELMTAGIRKLVDLAEEINAAIGTQQIEVIDIGGGLPVNFDSDESNRPLLTMPAHCSSMFRNSFPANTPLKQNSAVPFLQKTALSPPGSNIQKTPAGGRLPFRMPARKSRREPYSCRTPGKSGYPFPARQGRRKVAGKSRRILQAPCVSPET